MPNIEFATKIAYVFFALTVLLQNKTNIIFLQKDFLFFHNDCLVIDPLSFHLTVVDMDTVIVSILHDYCLWYAGSLLPDNLGW